MRLLSLYPAYVLNNPFACPRKTFHPVSHEIVSEKKHHASAMAEAKAAWTGEAEAAAASAGINFDGASPNEIMRAAMEIVFGKGHHEKPFVGREEGVRGAMTTLLEDEFFQTNSYHALRSRVFHVWRPVKRGSKLV